MAETKAKKVDAPVVDAPAVEAAPETVLKADFDKVVAENEKLIKAINSLLKRESDRHIADLIKELGLE